MVFASFHVLVNLGETFIDIPEKEHTKRGCGGCLTIVLALEDPVFVALLSQDQQVLAESCVHKGIDVCERQVFLGTIDSTIVKSAVLKVTLVDSIGVLGLHDVQIAGQ